MILKIITVAPFAWDLLLAAWQWCTAGALRSATWASWLLACPSSSPPRTLWLGTPWRSSRILWGHFLLRPLKPNHLMHQRWGKGTPIFVGPRSLLLLEQAVVLGII